MWLLFNEQRIKLNIYIDTRNSAIADQPREAFVQTQWHGWPTNTPFLYALPCRI